MVLTLLDKIIGAVDQIQQTQNSLEQRQQEMEGAVTGIQSELTKLAKSHTTTSNTVNKMLEKVRKVSINVKTVRQNLEKQAGQIKRLESNEAELLKRRNFKVMIYQVGTRCVAVLLGGSEREKGAEALERGSVVLASHGTIPLLPPSQSSQCEGDTSAVCFIFHIYCTVKRKSVLGELRHQTATRIFSVAVLVQIGNQFCWDSLQCNGRASSDPDFHQSRMCLLMHYELHSDDEVKVPSKVSVSKSLKELERVPEEGEEAEPQAEEQGGGEGGLALSSDEEVEIEEIIEESRAERIKRSSMRRVDDFKKAFSKEKMEKTRQKTRDNLEKTRQKTKENLEKTRHNIEKKMNKLGTRIVNTERKEKMKSSREKIKKSFTPDHTVYARSKTAVYKVPPFTFHVKKIREGEAERQGTELMEVAQEEEVDGGELLSEDNPEMQTLLEAAEDTELVLVERSRIREDSD
ncbi:CAVN1 protein, partial [Atractosteus spatula]|nr:CAVN1 protein [Atractosteus spatula]